MSKIEQEILEITGAKARRSSEEKADYLERLVDEVYSLEKEDWNELSRESQKWFNEAAQAINDEQSLNDFPDAEKSSSRAKSGKESVKEVTQKDTGEVDVMEIDDLEVGMSVAIETADDMYEGTVKKILSSRVILEDEDGESVRLSKDEIEEISSLEKEEKGKEEGDDGEVIEVDDLEVGMNVRVEVEDEEFEGEVLKVLSGTVILQTEDGREKVSKSDIDNITSLSSDDGNGEDEKEEKVSRKTSTRRSSRSSGRTALKRKEKGEESLEFEDVEAGMFVKITTTEDDELEGSVISVKPRSVVLKTSDGRKSVIKGKIEEMVEIAEEDLKEEPKKRGRRSSSTEGTGGGRGRRAQGKGGERVTTTIRKMLVKNSRLTLDKLLEKVKDADIQVSDSTVKMTFDGFKETYELLKESGKIS